MNIRLSLLAIALLALAGCVKEPEGPGERIGRGIDEIMKGLEEMDAASGTNPRYDERNDRGARTDEERKRSQDLHQSDRYADHTSL